MGMDLKVDCPHCDAKKGEICKEDCTANGEYVVKIKNNLSKINLCLDDFELKSKN